MIGGIGSSELLILAIGVAIVLGLTGAVLRGTLGPFRGRRPRSLDDDLGKR